MNRNFKIYAPPLLWALLIGILCGLPGKDIPHISFLELLSFDKWVHFGLFFVLVLLINRAVRQTANRKNSMVVALCLSIPYGGLLEIMQQELFEERSADLFDFIANSAGCFSAWAYWSIKNRVSAKRRLVKRSKIKS